MMIAVVAVIVVVVVVVVDSSLLLNQNHADPNHNIKKEKDSKTTKIAIIFQLHNIANKKQCERIMTPCVLVQTYGFVSVCNKTYKNQASC